MAKKIKQLVHTKVTSLEHLISLCNDEEMIDFFISLAGGVARSSKGIMLKENKKGFYVHNEIDGTYQTLSFKSLYTRSNIGEALDKGCLYAY